jgi:outer membrane protein OmpA-like peptidoglycan-associated protein
LRRRPRDPRSSCAAPGRKPPAAKPSFAPRPGGSPPTDRPAKSFQPQQLPPTKPAQPFAPPPSTKPFPSKPATAPPVELKKEGIKRFPPPSREGEVPPPKGAPSFERPPAAIAKPPSGPSGPGTVGPVSPRSFDPSKLRRLDDIQKDRRERVEDGGRRKLIEEPGNRLIVKENNQAIIRHDEAERFLRRPGARSERRADGTVETFYIRRDGVRIFTVVDANGRLLRRFRRDRDGREHNYIDNRRFYRNVGIGLGIGALIALNLRPPRVTIPYDSYILDYDDADDDDLYEALDAPLVDDIDRAYSLEEIRYNYELRARVRSIDLTSITFEFGSWEVAPDQYGRLERMARAILRVLRDNSDAVILIEGHTDAPGDEDYNLSLGDRRAQAVAEILTETFEVPPENLVTQGYGEQYLKVDTQEPEPRNRRVTFRNITGLMAER